MLDFQKDRQSAGDFEVYGDTVIDHFTRPRNVAPIAEPNATGYARSSVGGDFLRLTLRVDADSCIAAVCCRAFGRAAGLASGSAFSELIVGLTLNEALTITAADVVRALHGLPGRKLRCAELPIAALRAAVSDYQSRQVKADHRAGPPAPVAI
jgi:NifU-like protein